MVRDISEKLPAPAGSARRPLVSAETRAWLAEHVPRLVKALVPTAAALDLVLGGPSALVVGYRVARWTFLAGVAVALFRFGLELERRRWRRQPAHRRLIPPGRPAHPAHGRPVTRLTCA